jgi:hypothetical protein
MMPSVWYDYALTGIEQSDSWKSNALLFGIDFQQSIEF